MSVNIKMELDFSEQIKNLNILKSAEMQTRPDNAEMVMKNKAEGPEVEKEKMKSSEICEDCGKPESECECKESDEMEESDSAKKMKEDSKDKDKEKEDSKDKEKSEEKGKFPFDKFKKFDKSKASLPEKVSFMLQSKLQTHNEKLEQNLTFAQISKVYSRGLNVYKNNHVPNVKLHQWAIARVNLFLKMMGGNNVKNEYLLLDADVAHANSLDFKESGLASYDFVDFSNLEFQLAKISLVEAGITEQEMNSEITEAAEEKKK
jgi:hypothetical protein